MILPLAFLLVASGLIARGGENPFLGRWALTIPGGGAGWLGVEEKNGQLKGSILWGGGSVLPVEGIRVDGENLVVTRVHESQDKDAAGKPVVHKSTETITARVSGDDLKLETRMQPDAGAAGPASPFVGHRIPPLPPAPDLKRVRFAAPIMLFNGRDLTGWRLMGNAPNGWSVGEGVLRNRTPQEKGHHKSYANLRTEKEFEDFNLKLEFRVPENGNSGVYLRGIYEIQVANSFGRKNDPHNCGALYSRIMPKENVSRPPGAWQSFDITLVDRHLTVIHNGRLIIDNQPVLGCTGGALWSDESRPGPIYFQGDHSDVEYRNVFLSPVIR